MNLPRLLTIIAWVLVAAFFLSGLVAFLQGWTEDPLSLCGTNCASRGK